MTQATIDQGHLWLWNMRFSEHFGVSLNRDSFFYMVDAHDTRQVFRSASYLQSRPLMAFLAHPLGQAIARLPLPTPLAAQPWFNELLPWYLAFLVFNVVFLGSTYGAYVRLLGHVPAAGTPTRNPSDPAPTAAVLGLLLVANEVTKAFFLAAHVQMLNLLVPTLAILAFEVFRQPAARWRDALVTILLAGFGMLAYGGCVVLGATVLLAWCWSRRGAGRPLPWWLLAGEWLVLSACLLAPYAGWWWLVHGLTGGFYNNEIEHWHQIVWMRTSWQVGPGHLAGELLANVGFFALATLHHWRPAWPVVAVLALLSWPRRRAVGAGLRAAGPLLAGCAVAGVSYLLFFSLVGYRVDRLAMPTAVCGFVALGLWARVLEPLLPVTQRRALLGATLVFMVGQMAWMAAKDGPFG